MGWLDNMQDGGQFDGLTNKGFNYNGAWGGPAQNGTSIPGSVGFSYARTKGIPSEGKYAKKTMPSADFGTILNDPNKKHNNHKVKDDNGYWNPDNWGKVVEIGSNNITMEGVNQPLLGISDTGDVQYMEPGKGYKFDGKKVTEYPVAQNGKDLYQSKINDKSRYDPQKQWLHKWMSSPEYTKRLAKNVKESDAITKEHDLSDWIDNTFRGDEFYQGKAKTLSNEAKRKMLRTKVYTAAKDIDEVDHMRAFMKEGPKDEDARRILAGHLVNSAGLYDDDTKKTYISKFADPDTAVHEFTHASRLDSMMKNIIPEGGRVTRENEKLKKKYNLERVYSGDFGGLWGVPVSDKMPWEHVDSIEIPEDGLDVNPFKREYLNKTEEIYPRIMKLRYNGGIKPGQIINKKNFKDIKKKSSDDMIFEVYDDDQIIDMMNKLAVNNSQSSTTAEDGSQLIKLDQLTNFTNYNKPQKGGWLDQL